MIIGVIKIITREKDKNLFYKNDYRKLNLILNNIDNIILVTNKMLKETVK
jgi:hypothetical protein